MNHRTVSILLMTAVAAAGLTLSGCGQKQPSKQQMNQDANLMGAGVLKKASHAGQVIADSAITTKIKTQLATDGTLSGYDIHIDTNNGVVTLSGTVDNANQRERIGKIAKNTDGVKGVTNNIKVAPQS